MQYASINARMNRRGMLRRVSSGFTFVEILLVLVILALVTAIAVPKFAHAAQMARENTLKDDLRYLRTQSAVYKAQHKGGAPGCRHGAEASGSLFVQQMTQYTDESGICSTMPDGAFKFGPYLSKMPANPLTGNASIKILTGNRPLRPDNSSGWLYNPTTQEVIVNTTLRDANGIPYSQY